MIYQVRKDGRVVMETMHEKYRYPPQVENQMQSLGYDIYIDGKKQKKVRPAADAGR